MPLVIAEINAQVVVRRLNIHPRYNRIQRAKVRFKLLHSDNFHFGVVLIAVVNHREKIGRAIVQGQCTNLVESRENAMRPGKLPQPKSRGDCSGSGGLIVIPLGFRSAARLAHDLLGAIRQTGLSVDVSRIIVIDR